MTIWSRATAWIEQRWVEGLAEGMERVDAMQGDQGTVLDLSSNNPGTINFGLVRASGVEAVYLRATDGIGWVDPTFYDRAAAARAAGLDVGAYHFLRVRHGRGQDAEEQVRQHVEAATRAGVTLVSMVDCERAPASPEHNAATPDEWADASNEALCALRLLWAAPLLYASPSFLLERPEMSELAFGPARLWTASYTPRPLPVPPWGDRWTLWQWTGVGSCPGVTGHVDRSRLAAGFTIDMLRS